MRTSWCKTLRGTRATTDWRRWNRNLARRRRSVIAPRRMLGGASASVSQCVGAWHARPVGRHYAHWVVSDDKWTNFSPALALCRHSCTQQELIDNQLSSVLWSNCPTLQFLESTSSQHDSDCKRWKQVKVHDSSEKYVFISMASNVND